MNTRKTLLLCLLTFAVSVAGAIEPVAIPPIVGREKLESWRAGVAQADARAKPLTIVCFGDSNTEAPTYTVALRDTLQACYGDRGVGYLTFSPARSPIPRGAEAKFVGQWQAGAEPDGPKEPFQPPYYALDGYWATSEDAHAAVSVAFPAMPGNGLHRVRIHYQVGPGLGAFTVYIGTWACMHLDCAAEKPGYAISEPFLAEQFRLADLTGKVTLFGCDYDRRRFDHGTNLLTGGALVYALGHSWGMARHRAPTDEGALRAFFTAVHPDLVTVLFGTNDMHNDGRPASYRQALTELVDKVHRAAPGVGVLIITCPEAGQTKEGMAAEFAGVAGEVAAATGCACWDWRTVLGPHSRPAEMNGWMGDGLHYGPVGGAAFAHLLLRQLGFDINDPAHWTALYHPAEPSGHPPITLARRAPLTLPDVPAALAGQPVFSCWDQDRKAAEVQCAVAGEMLAVHARVADGRCTAERKSWEGGNLDVYISRIGSYAGDELEKWHGQRGIVRQLVIEPTGPESAARLSAHENGKEIPVPAGTVKITPLQPAGYTLDALIPLAFFLIDGHTAQFYLESAVVTAPGPGAPAAFSRAFPGLPDGGAFRDNTQAALATVQETK